MLVNLISFAVAAASAKHCPMVLTYFGRQLGFLIIKSHTSCFTFFCFVLFSLVISLTERTNERKWLKKLFFLSFGIHIWKKIKPYPFFFFFALLSLSFHMIISPWYQWFWKKKKTLMMMMIIIMMLWWLKSS